MRRRAEGTPAARQAPASARGAGAHQQQQASIGAGSAAEGRAGRARAHSRRQAGARLPDMLSDAAGWRALQVCRPQTLARNPRKRARSGARLPESGCMLWYMARAAGGRRDPPVLIHKLSCTLKMRTWHAGQKA